MFFDRPDALAHDPVNGRLLLIGAAAPDDDPDKPADAVWAPDLESGSWAEVVAQSH